MAILTEQYAFLSSQAYNSLSVGQVVGNGSNSYRILYTSDSSVDYNGAVFLDLVNGGIIVANGGTDFTDLHLVKADAIMVSGEEPPQAPEAMATMRWALQYASQNGITDVSATGHSLGGSLAQLQAAQFGVHAETFDAYGTYAIADRYDLNPEAAMDLVVNHRSYYDPVSSMTQQIGQTEYYMNASDYAHYMETGVLGMDQLDQLSSISKAHSLDYFWNSQTNQATGVFADNYWDHIDPDSSTVSLYLDRLKHLGSQLSSLLSGVFSIDGIRAQLAELFGIAKTTVSPLILDLDGDGVETTTLGAGVHFDQDGNGFAERSAWVGKDDGLLAWDRNGNGGIDDGTELFGNNTRLADGSRAANGFQALAELDGNQDGRLDANDAAFSSLRVWRDGNGNGRTDAGELLTLEQAGVGGIDLGYANATSTDINGNAHRQTGSYVRSDGTTATVDDVWFRADLTDTIDKSATAIDATIAALPDISGFGNVRSLHQAMAHDTGGALAALVEHFGEDADATDRQTLAEQILLAWTGADHYQASSRGGYLADGRKLYALEAFMGETFVQGSGTNEGTNNPGPDAADALMQAYDRLAAQVYGQLMLQTHFKPMLGMVGIKPQGDGFGYDVSALVAELRGDYQHDPDQTLATVSELATTLQSVNSDGTASILAALTAAGDFESSPFEIRLAIGARTLIEGSAGDDSLNSPAAGGDALLGHDGNDTLTGGAGDDLLGGGAGDDSLNGGGGTNRLAGGAGNDVLKVDGYSRDNVLSGGTGDDTLNGSYYSDTYRFDLGDGKDTIVEVSNNSGAVDTLTFGEGIEAEDVQTIRQGADLVFAQANGTDEVRVKGWFNNANVSSGENVNSTLEKIAFADGTSWSPDDLHRRGYLEQGTIGNDTLAGWQGNDLMLGGDGDDTLDGGAGTNSLDGGAGNDVLKVDGYSRDNVLSGGTGDDTLNGSYYSDTYGGLKNQVQHV